MSNEHSARASSFSHMYVVSYLFSQCVHSCALECRAWRVMSKMMMWSQQLSYLRWMEWRKNWLMIGTHWRLCRVVNFLARMLICSPNLWTGFLPANPSQPITCTHVNPYPKVWVWVTWGRGAGSSGKPQGYPYQSLTKMECVWHVEADIFHLRCWPIAVSPDINVMYHTSLLIDCVILLLVSRCTTPST